MWVRRVGGWSHNGVYGTNVRLTHGLSRYSRTCDTKTASPEMSLQNAVGSRAKQRNGRGQSFAPRLQANFECQHALDRRKRGQELFSPILVFV